MAKEIREREIEDIVDALKECQKSQNQCALFIGSGCSRSGEIPVAREIVEEIKNIHERAYNRAKEKTYQECMAELTPVERKKLLRNHIDKAKINWAHVCIAILLKNEYVDRIMTTNFDPLIIKACALFQIFPAIYDCASSKLFNAKDIPEKAIFYLQGQGTGFVLINTKEEFKKHSKFVKPIFEEVGTKRPWIVVGYSGENDPVFAELCKIRSFDNYLYWVGYEQSEPGDNLREKLLLKKSGVFYVKGFNADDFFVTLTQQLNCFPPDFVTKPFSFLNGFIDTLTSYNLPHQESKIDVLNETREKISEAISKYEKFEEDKLSKPAIIQTEIEKDKDLATKYLMAGEYEKVIELVEKYNEKIDPTLADTVTWAYIMEGNSFFNKAKVKQGPEADKLFMESYKKFEQALKFKPDMHEAFCNWGLALFEHAKTKQGPEADKLFEESYRKFEKALKFKPDMHEAFSNWGLALSEHAKTKQGPEADKLFEESYREYEQALKFKPEKYLAFNNWGVALSDQAKGKQGLEADKLFEESYKKFEQALKFKPDMHEAFSNWGLALFEHAKTKQGPGADKLFEESYRKFEQALKFKPDMHEAFSNWGFALSEHAKTKQGPDADKLFEESYRKFEQVLKFKPDKYIAFFNWGNALSDQAKSKKGPQADKLFEESYFKYEQAIKFKPNMQDVFNNWGNALSEKAKTKQGPEADKLFEESYKKYAQAIKIKPDKYEAFSNWGIALTEHAKTKQGPEADKLFEESYRKFEQVLKFKPDKYIAFFNWGNALSDQAKSKKGPHADKLFEESYFKYEQAIKFKPDMQDVFNNWGNALFDQAKTKQGQEADKLFSEAYNKYRQALKFKPDMQSAYNNWGTALMAHAKTEKDIKALQLFGESKEKLIEAESIVEGSSSYNLACLSAIQLNFDDCRKWLNKARKTGFLPSLEHIRNDPDLDGVRNQKWFKKYLEKAFQKNK